MKTVLVFGVSGVGKSWLCGQVAKRLGLRHVSGSALIRAEKERLTCQNVSVDALRTDHVVDNQRLLLDGFRNYKSQDTKSILFDGHNVIDSGHGYIEISSEVIVKLQPAAIALIVDSPANIFARRSADLTRDRPQRSVDDLARYQDLCLDLAKDQANSVGIPITSVRSGDTDTFCAFLQRLI